MKEFIRRLVRAVKEEKRAEIAAMMSEIKRLSGEERERRGHAILGLRGKRIGELLDQDVVRFGREREIKTKISVGDVVLISRGNPLRSDVKGTVVRVGKRFVDVAVQKFQNWMRRDVRIDLIVDDTTFRRWLDVLETLPENAQKALELAIGNAKPEPVEETTFVPVNRELDDSKMRAISKALGAKDFFIIHGPFGTGKTTALAEYIVQEVRRGKKVLATAETNVAVDNLVEKLAGKVKLVRIGNPARVSDKLISTTLYAKMEGHPDYGKLTELKNKIDELRERQELLVKPVPKFRRGMTDEQILKLAEKGKGIRGVNAATMRAMAEWIQVQKEVERLVSEKKALEERIITDIIRNSDVVLTTNSSAALDYVPNNFDVAVIDEASQATIPSVLIPISKARKFVLAGDHKQLPPTILSQKAKILERTLFEMLVERCPDHSAMLEVQYRMNERLAEFPSKEFYGGKVKTAENVKNITLRDLGVNDTKVLVFLDTRELPAKHEKKDRGSESYYNPVEAEVVTRAVHQLLERGVKREWIGVITPYDAQRDFLSRILPEDVEVNTVDGFQGREKEVIVVSFVRSNRAGNIGFLNDLRRLNVALTRAKRKLVLVGDSETLGSHPTYKRLIEHVKRRGEYVTLAKKQPE
ncbi:MAG: hypothetical protein PWP76_443 [Candidatus Diapherotrites archaeon]|nr:hypothetical protein [Candidatus Diapherotrites archaeon]MDN5367109.1 hypothetical protein [Candidatus Diapherotrites archaeon]